MSTWQDRAECYLRAIPDDLFFPEPGEGIDSEVIRACAVCQVRQQCLNYALDHERTSAGGPSDRHGIWGGYTGRGRTELEAGRYNVLPIFDLKFSGRRRAVA